MTRVPIDVGPLEPLLADESVTAIDIDGAGVRCVRHGVMHTTAILFASDDQLRHVIESIVQAGGETISDDRPLAACVLADGTRVRAGLNPLTLSLFKQGHPA